MTEGPGNKSGSTTGKFIHAGGWLFVHENNTIDVSLAECCPKEDFAFEELKPPHGLESESPAGKIASHL